MHPLLSRPENFVIPHLGLAEEHLRLATMVYVPGGTFRMGSGKDDPEALSWEKPDHNVRIPSFFIGKFPVTCAIWKAIIDINSDSTFQINEKPVEHVSWPNITQEFLPALVQKTGLRFRLPSESEWEYAALGGPLWQERMKYSGSDKLKEVGWFVVNSHSETKPVGLKYPNQLGLHDMSGNMWEWVQDQWHKNYEGAPDDGSAWQNNDKDGRRILRGGSSRVNSRYCYIRYRDRPANILRKGGFRLAISFFNPSSNIIW